MEEMELTEYKKLVKLYVRVDGKAKKLEFNSPLSLPGGCDTSDVVEVFLVHAKFVSQFKAGQVVGGYESDLQVYFDDGGQLDAPPPYT
ncbi:hypothetical protein H4218_006060 [Coemansia sp. IMI 209128]|nr:hypothetical protein H4218_006060 [Coemansia sp. IMI 209128]